jgi:hypothetical protein
MEVKLCVGYTGKEAHNKTGKSKRLKNKFVLIDIGKYDKKFMEELSLIAESKFSLSKIKKFSLEEMLLGQLTKIRFAL